MTNVPQGALPPAPLPTALNVDRGHATRAEIASLLRASGYLVVDEHVAISAPLRNVIAHSREPILILLSPGRKRLKACD